MGTTAAAPISAKCSQTRNRVTTRATVVGVRVISREGILITRDMRIVSTRRPSPISVEATRTDTPLRGSVGIDALAEALEDASGAHAASNAHGNHAVAGVATLQFTDERRRELCAGAAERVA